MCTSVICLFMYDAGSKTSIGKELYYNFLGNFLKRGYFSCQISSIKP